MDDKQLLAMARDEIRGLRRSNEIMGAQLDVLETIRLLVAGPRPPQMMTQDVCHEIDKRLAQ
jgi:hypothetical protein